MVVLGRKPPQGAIVNTGRIETKPYKKDTLWFRHISAYYNKDGMALLYSLCITHPGFEADRCYGNCKCCAALVIIFLPQSHMAFSWHQGKYPGISKPLSVGVLMNYLPIEKNNKTKQTVLDSLVELVSWISSCPCCMLELANKFNTRFVFSQGLLLGLHLGWNMVVEWTQM